MNRIPLIVSLLVVLPNVVYAGHGTILETDSQFIVEYEGDSNEVIAANIVKEKEEKLQAQIEQVKAKEVERIQKFTESAIKHKEERRAKYNEGSED